jgi:hypothetical protein
MLVVEVEDLGLVHLLLDLVDLEEEVPVVLIHQ